MDDIRIIWPFQAENKECVVKSYYDEHQKEISRIVVENLKR